ncbi:MAG TPA: hypothetical protein VJU77_03620 [Chthoniobacterales bacterium]|nr:hypothetical protein [Chthoniobacterales bacterium]
MQRLIPFVPMVVVWISCVSTASSFGPSPNSYSVVLVSAAPSGAATAKVHRKDVKEPDRIFATYEALQDFCATLPDGAQLRYVYPMQSALPPGSHIFLNRFNELQAFCASRCVKFERLYPDW